jgi:hypothetical protein
VACALLVASLLGPGAAAAAPRKPPPDTTPPTIVHTPITTCPVGPDPQALLPCVIEAEITDPTGVFDPTLLVKAQGAAAFERLPMKPREGGPADLYAATVPPTLLAAGTVDYLIEAFDVEGNGPARAGSEEAPLTVVRAAPTLITAAEPEPVEDNSGLWLGVGVAAGVVVLAAVGVGVGVALLSARPPAIDEVTLQVGGPLPIATALFGGPPARARP